MSTFSQRSTSSKNSKRVTKNSQVDEALFGSKKPTTADAKRKEEIAKVTQEVRRGELKNPNAVIIPSSELQRIKNTAVILSKEEQLQQKKILEEQNEKQLAAARAKKEKMLEIEAERKRSMPQEQDNFEERLQSDSLQSRAQQLMNEQKDAVKHMNQMMLYAKVATVRDKQLEEKKEIQDMRKIEEKRKDLAMEVERLRKIKYYEDQEKVKKEEQRRKALEIVDQIKERELERLREQEEKEREGQEIVRAIKQNEAESANQNLRKKTQQKVLNEEISGANRNAIQTKQVKIQQEREEEEKIVQYNIEKAQKEAEYVAEQKRIKDEKEREVQRLREKQEKHHDRQAEMDELRAKRAVEAAERDAREKQRSEAEKKARMNQDLLEARHIQSLEKERRLEEQAKQERDEFQRVIQTQKMERDLELKMEHDKKLMVLNHAEQVKKQIAVNEEKSKLAQRSKLEEGKKIKDQLVHEKRLLENIKEDKLNELKGAGIKDKYQTELSKKKIIA